MQVDIAVPGNFHASKIGRQLESRSSLRRIYTTYPKFATDRREIPDKRFTHIRYPELIAQVGQKFPILNEILPSQRNNFFNRWKGITFDKSIARRLKPAEDGLFLGFAGVCLESLQRANELGLTTVVERSSAHIRTQKEILDEEYQKYEQGELSISRQHVQREEKEYRIADYVSVPSEFAYQSFANQGFPESKLVEIPFGYTIRNNIQTGNNRDEITFLYAGAVDIQKGVHYLLDSFSLLGLSKAKLKLAGNMSESMIEVVEDYKDNPQTEFLGWVDNMDQLYRNSDVFVFPSLQEGSAMVNYEAMANGLPVITTFNSGWVGEDGEHGIEVPPYDSESIAEAMQYMYNNPEERKQMGENARDHITSNFTEDDYGERIFSEYQSMINQ